ncbi:hypothetical protein LguiA_014057 [Lonicera macranthoides]
MVSTPDALLACHEYLVEELFMVGQDLDKGEGLNVHQDHAWHTTEDFKVYKLDSINSSWVEVEIGKTYLLRIINDKLFLAVANHTLSGN